MQRITAMLVQAPTHTRQTEVKVKGHYAWLRASALDFDCLSYKFEQNLARMKFRFEMQPCCSCHNVVMLYKQFRREIGVHIPKECKHAGQDLRPQLYVALMSCADGQCRPCHDVLCLIM